MRQPRVLMVVGAYYPELAGGSLQCRTLMQALHDRVEFAVLTTTGDRRLPVNDRIDGVPVHRVFIDPSRLASKISGTWRLLRLAPRLAKTVARDAGARAAVLDPIEGITGGNDYFSVMRQNLRQLRTALGCR